MNKHDLITQMAEASGLSKSDSAKALDALMDTITKTLAEGGEITLIGFGRFAVKERAERTGRNPRTGEPITIAAAKIPHFYPGKGLKEVC